MKHRRAWERLSFMAVEHEMGTRKGEEEAEVSGPEYLFLLEEVQKCFPEKKAYKLKIED